MNFDEKSGWIKSETACICVTWLTSSCSLLDQMLYPRVHIWAIQTVYGIQYGSYALKCNPKVFFITSVILIGSIVMIRNRLLSRQLESPPEAKNKSILAITNVFCSNDSVLQNRERPVLIDYNGDLFTAVNRETILNTVESTVATVKRMIYLCFLK